MTLRFIIFSLILVVCAPGLEAQGTFTDDDIVRDNVEGNHVLLEVGHIRPMAVRGNFLFTINQPGSRFVGPAKHVAQ